MGHKTPTDHSSAAQQPVVEKGAIGPGATHAAVHEEVAPRLPHDRDESSDSGTGEPTERKRLAARDMEDGHVDVQRGSATLRHYSGLTGQAQEKARTDTQPD